MQTIVGVLRGGPSLEHETSLKTGATMLGYLPRERYDARDIYIDKTGQWHDRGRAVAPEKILQQIDVALIGLHGTYGEDGQVQSLLDRYGVPYTGSDMLGSRLAMHKVLAKHRARDAGFRTPEYFLVEHLEDGPEVVYAAIRKLHQPVVVKPVGWGSSLGVTMSGGYDAVLKAVQALFAEGALGVLVEERIRGREATVGVVEGLRGESLYVLPTVEVEHPPEGYLTHTAKHDPATKKVTPGNFSRKETEELKRAAAYLHSSLGLRHYSRSDFIVNPRGIYYLETNSLPSLAPGALMPHALSAVGIGPAEFLSHVVALALRK